jgi:hypothetical protein
MKLTVKNNSNKSQFMTNQDAKKITNDVFKRICESESIDQIETIFEKLKIPEKNRMKSDTYPQIKFKLNKEDIDSLIKDKLIDEHTFTFKNDISKDINDPLTKLLYSTVWKNGDLKKVKHIIKGVTESNNNTIEQDDALVFYQFGKYLTKEDGQPIIDQHVIRAFIVYNSDDINKLEMLRKFKTFKKSDKDVIIEYKNWLKGDLLSKKLKAIPDYTYHIDKLLFATGKTIKIV